MRLSATERIMREAEQHGDDAVAPVNHGDTERVSTVPLTQMGFASPRMPTPLSGGVDIDVDIEDLADGGDDDEGETQVDAQRSAAALNKMRALEATGVGPPPLPGSRQGPMRVPRRANGIPPGRPPASRLSPTPAAPTSVSPAAPGQVAIEPGGPSTLTFPPAVMAAALHPQPVPLDNNRSEHAFSSSRLQFGSPAAQPVTPALSSIALVRPRGVGRRTGVLIAISTAAAVALIAGAWTTKRAESTPQVTAAGSLASRPSASTSFPGAAQRPIAAVVVATPPVVPPTVEPPDDPGEPAPTTEPAPAAPTPEATAPEPEAAKATAPIRLTAAQKRAAAVAAKRAAVAAAKSARLAKKAQATANKRRARAQRAAAKSTARAAVVAAPMPTASQVAPHPAGPSRGGRGDPDDTLPPTD